MNDNRPTDAAGWVPVAALLSGVGWGANQFVPLLPVYRHALGLGPGTLEGLFAFYAAGLIPGLLIAGPISDARGRRPVVVPAALLSLAASVVLAAGAQTVAVLFVGRLMAGVASGVAFGAGTAWLREASAGVGEHVSARRAAISMTIGFAFGPLVSGVLAQWAPDPRVVCYLPHLAIMALVLLGLRYAPETLEGANAVVRFSTPAVRNRRFRRVVAPVAPWVFAAPAIGFALLPDVVHAGETRDGVAFVALVTSVTAFAGVLVQPLAKRAARGSQSSRVAACGLLVAAAALVVAAVCARTGSVWLLFPSGVLFGSAYGLCLVAGLVEVGRIAPRGGLAQLTAAYFALTYLGFAAPNLFALLARVASYPTLLSVGALVALLTAAAISRPDAQPVQRSVPRSEARPSP